MFFFSLQKERKEDIIITRERKSNHIPPSNVPLSIPSSRRTGWNCHWRQSREEGQITPVQLMLMLMLKTRTPRLRFQLGRLFKTPQVLPIIIIIAKWTYGKSIIRIVFSFSFIYNDRIHIFWSSSSSDDGWWWSFEIIHRKSFVSGSSWWEDRFAVIASSGKFKTAATITVGYDGSCDLYTSCFSVSFCLYVQKVREQSQIWTKENTIKGFVTNPSMIRLFTAELGLPLRAGI